MASTAAKIKDRPRRQKLWLVFTLAGVVVKLLFWVRLKVSFRVRDRG